MLTSSTYEGPRNTIISKVVTANRLDDGEVVYLTENGDWSPRLTEGRAFEGDEEDRMLLNAAKAEADLQIVAPYAMDVARDDSGLSPTSQRERIRSQGPTVGTEPQRRAVISSGERS